MPTSRSSNWTWISSVSISPWRAPEFRPIPAPPAGLDQPWSDKPINLDWLNFLDAEMQITAADLRVDRFRFAPISVGVILTNGVLTTGLVRTGIYGGQIQGTLVVDASQAPSQATLFASI